MHDLGALRFLPLAVGAVGRTVHPHSAEGGGGVYWIQPGQAAQKAEGWERGSLGQTIIFLFFFFHYYHHDKKTCLPQVRA